MVHGIGHYALVTVAALFAILWIHLLCRYNRTRGRAEGIRDEAMAWCEAFDNIMVPNWQSLPVDPEMDKQGQEAFNKLYVMAFRAALQAIGEEVALARVEALKKEFRKLGLVVPVLPKLEK